MITDLFHGHKCICGNRYRKNAPLTFRRIKQIKVYKGLDYLCECLKCKKTFRIEFLRWGVHQ
jgi:hypothetical protein